MTELLANETTSRILSCAFEVHAQLGPGLLESTYQRCLMQELRDAGLKAASEIAIPIRYKDLKFECGYRADIVVDDEVLVELKTVERILPIHMAQLMTYLKLSAIPVGLLMNFNSVHLRHGFRRIVM